MSCLFALVPKHGCFLIVGVWGVGGEEVRKACMREMSSGERGVGRLLENKLRRGESSCLCMKFGFAFFAGHNMLIRVLLPSFLARCL